MINIKHIESKVSELGLKLKNQATNLEQATIREAKETYEAAQILLRMAKGNDVTETDIQFLKNQSVDIVKILTIIGLQAIPFSSAAIIAIETVARKHGFSIFPTSQNQ